MEVPAPLPISAMDVFDPPDDLDIADLSQIALGSGQVGVTLNV
jgi:hypothetical protein